MSLAFPRTRPTVGPSSTSGPDPVPGGREHQGAGDPSSGGRTRSARRRLPVPLALAAGAVALLTLVPVGYLLVQSFDRGVGFVATEVFQARTAALVARSLALVTVVTVACVLLGTVLAVLVTRTTLPGRRWLAVALALPLAVPSYVLAYALVSQVPSAAGFWGAAAVLTVVSYPYVLLPVTAALLRVDPAQEEVARSLGATGWSVLWQVTLRRARSSIAAGGLLVALYVLSDFGAVATLRYESFTWVIYGAYRAGFNPSRAAVLSVVLLVFATGLLIAEARVRGRASVFRVGSGVARPAPPLVLGRGATVAATALVAVPLVAGLVFPAVTLARWVLASASAGPDLADLGSALGWTVTYAAAAAVVSTALAVPVALAAARYGGPVAGAVERLTFLTHALPGIVVAVAGVYLGARVLRPLYQSAPLLVAGYVILFLPLAVGALRAALESVPVRWEEVAVSLGRSPGRAFLAVTGPAITPALTSGAALVLLAAMKELPVTLLLHPTGVDTLATRLWTFTSVSDYGGAAPYAVALVLFAAVPTAVLAIRGARPEGGR